VTCRDAIAVLADYLEQALDPSTCAVLEHHLADCAPCRAYLATYAKTREIGAAAQRVPMPDEMKARLRRFLLDRLERP
jgi:predicted anti-sigma-YlaC factor YlaD